MEENTISKSAQALVAQAQAMLLTPAAERPTGCTDEVLSTIIREYSKPYQKTQSERFDTSICSMLGWMKANGFV